MPVWQKETIDSNTSTLSLVGSLAVTVVGPIVVGVLSGVVLHQHYGGSEWLLLVPLLLGMAAGGRSPRRSHLVDG